MGSSYTPNKHGVSYPDHTADVWLRVEADSIEDLVIRSIHGFYGIMAEEYCLDEGGQHTLSYESGNLETLIVVLLSDLLYYFEAEKVIFLIHSVLLAKENDIYRIEITGSKHEYEIPGGRSGIEIKAVTYHGADVRCEEGGKWKMMVLLDL